ncbi:hypothetical protein, partial [Rhizobium leguminosarum]|uniref:hypothetical protein n=1 Tax=Rhizobium leguminosarum TaxID=384 RepID=UPI001A8F059B
RHRYADSFRVSGRRHDERHRSAQDKLFHFTSSTKRCPAAPSSRRVSSTLAENNYQGCQKKAEHHHRYQDNLDADD